VSACRTVPIDSWVPRSLCAPHAIASATKKGTHTFQVCGVVTNLQGEAASHMRMREPVDAE
jgi:hypothetical protein